ncbi:MAG TPA: hypothetical protein VLB03_04410 [Nocardioidaceae bacterium]|nr:hypothetical protein [Nocardioidaceae bacterium]
MVFAHGVGGAQDLPIPAELAIAGASAALAISFIVLAIAWRTPRYDAATSGRRAPEWLSRLVDSPYFEWTLRLLGLAFFGYVAVAALFGPDLLVNPTFGVVYVLLWVGLVPASLLFGPFYKAVNPVRTLHLLFSLLTGGDPKRGMYDLPRWVGYWPAAVGLFAFVWLELVYPDATYLSPIRLWFAIYIAVLLVGSALFGSEWFERADPFEVYSTLVGHLSVFGRREDGMLVLRSPLANLDAVPAGPGLVAVVSVLFGSTAFDSFKDMNAWLQFSQTTSLPMTWVNTLVMLGFCLVVGLSLTAATVAAAPREGVRRSDLPALFAHSVVPIIVGYMVAHYLTYLVESGQQTLIQLSDPLGTGANLLGTADGEVNYWLSAHPTFLAVTKVLAVVTGHVVGVVAAHDRAMKLLPKRHQLTGQLPLLVVMVFYTITGLYLLFGA